MKSAIVKRSIVIAGHRTSVSIEDAFWRGLKDIAVSRRSTLTDLIAFIDGERRHANLSSAIRLFVLDHYRPHTDERPDEGSPPALSGIDEIAGRPERTRRTSRRPPRAGVSA